MSEQLENLKVSIERLLEYCGLTIVPISVGIAFKHDLLAVKSLSGETLAEFSRFDDAVSYALDVVIGDLSLAVLPGWRSYQQWIEGNRSLKTTEEANGQPPTA